MTLKEKLKSSLKEFWFEIWHDPNSIEGLRHLADRLIAEGYSEDNPMVTVLRKMADAKEKENKQREIGS